MPARNPNNGQSSLIAFVTGDSSGIGKVMARELASRGTDLVLVRVADTEADLSATQG